MWFSEITQIELSSMPRESQIPSKRHMPITGCLNSLITSEHNRFSDISLCLLSSVLDLQDKQMPALSFTFLLVTWLLTSASPWTLKWMHQVTRSIIVTEEKGHLQPPWSVVFFHLSGCFSACSPTVYTMFWVWIMRTPRCPTEYISVWMPIQRWATLLYCLHTQQTGMDARLSGCLWLLMVV